MTRSVLNSAVLALSLVACSGPSNEGGDEADGAVGTDASLTDGAPSTAIDAAPDAPVPDCSAIANNPNYHLCESTDTTCAGVFTDGSGCAAFCATAGMTCVARFGGEPACQKEASVVLGCDDNNGHTSDWCECARVGDSPTCPTNPQNLPRQLQMNKDQAVYEQRHNWAVTCSPHAYTAYAAEHQACDSTYNPDGSRHGKAIFTFVDVPPGNYEVTIQSRHTENRNPAGALFYVNDHPRVINQLGPNDTGYVWDVHGTYCLEGTVNVVLDSTVNGGSDAVSAVQLTPTF